MDIVLERYLQNIYKNEVGEILGDYSASNGQSLELRIVFPKNFPISLPKIYINNWDTLRIFIPHVETNGLVCYTTSNNILYDSTDTEKILLASVLKAIETIEDGIQKKNNEDFRKEFIAFWDQQKNSLPVCFFANPDNSVKKLTISLSTKSKRIILNDKNSSYSDVPVKIFHEEIEPYKNIDVQYIPLRQKNHVLPPNPKNGWSKKELISIVRKNTTQSTKRQFNYWINQKTQITRLLIIKIPISNQNEILVGFWFKKNPKSIKKRTLGFIPVVVQRFDLQYLLERTSGEHYFTELNACIVGLGSVGSKLSTELANLGITRLTLIDPDRFESDNLFRHSLGADSLFSEKYNYKVDCLQTELERKNPYLNVEAESMDILDLLHHQPNYFNQFDFTFICTGETMVNLEINRILSQTNNKIFYSWVEPLGVGGHSLYVDYSNKGCFRCLNIDPANNKIISNRSSLIKPGQHIEKNLASCRSAFVPYGSLTSSEAAIRTAELFYKVVTKQVSKNSLYTWLGDTYSIEQMGYKLSNRFKKNKDNFPIIEENFGNQKCELCGAKKC